MACPKCGCRVCYQHDPDPELIGLGNDNLQRCAACGYVFDLDDDVDDDEFEDMEDADAHQ